MHILLVAAAVTISLFAIAAAALLVAGRARGGALPAGRIGRLARVGRLSARLATSSAGARARRLLSGRAGGERHAAQRRARDAEAVTRAMGEMKGAFMKLGQMLSFVSDAVPPEYRAALESLQAEAPPLGFGAVRDVVERELAAPLERAFARFEREPIASASIGQVHRARLPTGEDVAVKVQYPGVAEAIGADLANAGLLYRAVALLYPALEPGPVVEELQSRIGEELDYRREAINQAAFAGLYDGHPFIRVPRVFGAHSTGRVLTSELVRGRRMAELDGADPAERNHVAEVLYRFVFGSLIRFAVFNGDPHPGNYLVGERPGRRDGDVGRDGEGGRGTGAVTFLDFGCVKRFPDAMVATWMQLVCAHLEGRRDAFRDMAGRLGFLPPGSPVDTDLLYDYFRYFYEPFHEDRVFTFSPEYNARSLAMVFRPEGKFAGLGAGSTCRPTSCSSTASSGASTPSWRGSARRPTGTASTASTCTATLPPPRSASSSASTARRGAAPAGSMRTPRSEWMATGRCGCARRRRPPRRRLRLPRAAAELGLGELRVVLAQEDEAARAPGPFLGWTSRVAVDTRSVPSSRSSTGS
ncbi:MAG TPA: AarF/ABC1/UbiB kinase family protein [Kofleriaceae bacterium]|nr:AarF/ABC1/UbiB kinase family protein [Kofleriaceae bacterium]